MGTNYYLTSVPCKCCGRIDEPRHIGKSSAGWCFSLHVYPDEGIETLANWRNYFNDKDTLITDEYGRFISSNEMIHIIAGRKNKHSLQRHEVDGWHCIGHGEGTYDYIVGEFS